MVYEPRAAARICDARSMGKNSAISSAVGAGIAVPLVPIEQEDDRQHGN
jgi:hypothetical protein